MIPLSSVSEGDLLCHALRHRWVPRRAAAGNAGGARVWQWELECVDGCGSTAIEWRDNFDVRLPGTTRQYQPTESYKKSSGYTQSEYLAELRARGFKR